MPGDFNPQVVLSLQVVQLPHFPDDAGLVKEALCGSFLRFLPSSNFNSGRIIEKIQICVFFLSSNNNKQIDKHSNPQKIDKQFITISPWDFLFRSFLAYRWDPMEPWTPRCVSDWWPSGVSQRPGPWPRTRHPETGRGAATGKIMGKPWESTC